MHQIITMVIVQILVIGTKSNGIISSLYINGIKCKESVNVTNKESVPVVVNTSTKEGATIYNNKTKKSYKVKSGGTADVQIVEGTNTLTITLDTGYKETRKIYSQKEEEVEANQIEDEPEVIRPSLKSLTIEGVNLSPEFASDVYQYTITLPENTEEDITKLNINAIANNEECTIEIVGNENLAEGENIITIIVKSKDGNQAKYSLLVIKPVKIVETIAEPIDEEVYEEEENTEEVKKSKMIIVVVALVTAIIGIVLGIIEYDYSKKHKKDLESKIPYAKVGFENDTDKEDVLEEFKQDDKIEEKTTKKGKHF